MTVVDFSPLPALIGGAMIGLAAAGLWFTLGRIAGVSNILGAALVARQGDVAWRIAFLGGLFAAGLIGIGVFPERIAFSLPAGWTQVAVAGLLVGIGTQMGGGCTSGHGVCGVSRLSLRSIIATLIFMATGMITVYVWMHSL
ncbi:MAG: YeeE/YedE family protein [Burkholderiales bacterium]